MSFPFGNYMLFPPGSYYPSYDREHFSNQHEGRMDAEVMYLERTHQYNHDSVEHVQFLPSRSTGHWQSEHDLPYRRMMIAEISRILKLQDKERSASPEWLRKLPQMVKQLEISLYRSAPSLEAYCDPSTLRWRLQQLKEEITIRRHAQTMQQMKYKSDESRNADNDREANRS